jgi:uncharacterized RDD family membrane protein YckC/RNA polymerase subunit RPABC4/transcription elongation factor Spt4
VVECANCGRSISEGAAYCNYCGGRRRFVCNNCLTINPPDSNFCHACGSSLSTEQNSRRDAANTAYSQSNPAQSSKPSSSCPRCSQVNEPGSVYCFSCGLSLDADIRESSAAKVAEGRPAGFWIRLVAYLIDVVILFAVQILLIGVLPGMSPAEYFDAEGPIWTWIDTLFLFVGALYDIIGWTVWSTTPGKRAVGLYVLRPDGSKLGLGRAFARWLAYIPSALILGIGFLMIGFRHDKRGLHDLLCDTVIVKR